MPLFRSKKPSPPERPKHSHPKTPGAYIFTLRSVPHHYTGLLQAIESTNDTRVYFSEALAYIEGKGVSLFRVEATGFAFLEHLFRWWAETERKQAFPFDVNLYVHNKRWVASLRGKTPASVEALIRKHAPKHEANR